MHRAIRLANAAALVPAWSVRAAEIYATNHLGTHPASGPDTLIRFDSSDPAGYVTVGSMGVNNVGFGGLEFDNQGRLWAYATFNKFTGGATSGLYRVDTKTGQATLQGTQSQQTLTDLAFNRVNGTMYGVYTQGLLTSRLYTVNLTTGAVTLVGVITGLPSSHNLVGLAIDSTGAAFIYDNYNKTLYSVSATLAVTPLYSSELVMVGSQGIGIDWSRQDTGYHGAVGQGQFPNYFSQLNTFATDGSGYEWGASFGPNFPDGLPPVQAGDLAVVPETAAVCYANCDSSTITPVLNVADFACFLNRFSNGDPYANCDASTIPPVLNVADFTCFLNQFAAGCP
jgi:hypothetical protein